MTDCHAAYDTLICAQRIPGTVKWFNNKLGYGFITHILDNSKYDIFVHWSNLLLPDQYFHTLHKDERVEFEIQRYAHGPRSLQACRVSGPNLSPLLTVKKCFLNQSLHTSKAVSTVFSVRQLQFSDFAETEKRSFKLILLYSQDKFNGENSYIGPFLTS